jgi:hypothetical protein
MGLFLVLIPTLTQVLRRFALLYISKIICIFAADLTSKVWNKAERSVV